MSHLDVRLSSSLAQDVLRQSDASVSTAGQSISYIVFGLRTQDRFGFELHAYFLLLAFPTGP